MPLIQLHCLKKAFHQCYSQPSTKTIFPLLFEILKLIHFWLFHMILSLHPCRSRFFISLVLDDQFQNNSCWIWYWAAQSIPPNENLGTSSPILRGWTSQIAVSTARRVFSLQKPLWFAFPGVNINSEIHQNKIGKWLNELVTWWFMEV